MMVGEKGREKGREREGGRERGREREREGGEGRRVGEREGGRDRGMARGRYTCRRNSLNKASPQPTALPLSLPTRGPSEDRTLRGQRSPFTSPPQLCSPRGQCILACMTQDPVLGNHGNPITVTGESVHSNTNTVHQHKTFVFISSSPSSQF